jgi:leader peptidase (prepilin peptidase)/N-methyltransferase
MGPPLAFVVLVGILGLAVGSFLNVVIYRVPRQESIVSPASRCPNCDAFIKNRHNVPVLGWLMLRGRCAACSAPISARYPVVEAATAALFVLLALRFGLTGALPAYLYLAAVAVALAVIDIDAQRLPNAIVLPSYVVGIALLMPAGAVHADWWGAVRALMAMAAMWLMYAAITLAFPDGTGFGNVKLAGLLGIYLGWLSWQTVAVGAFGGLLIAALVGIALATGPRALTIRPVPLGASMVLAALLALFFTQPLAHWYGTISGSA